MAEPVNTEYSEETKTWARGLRVHTLARFTSRELIEELRRRGKRIVIPLTLGPRQKKGKK